MNDKKAKKDERTLYSSNWIWESLMIAMILPAIVYSVLSLARLPIV